MSVENSSSLLLDPGQAPNDQRVPPLAAMTKPEPIVIGNEERHYMLAERNASMHRLDGTRLGFMFGHLATKILADIKYLDAQIESGAVAALRYATPEEIRAAKMRKDPTGTITDELRPKIEADVRAELETRIRAEIEAELRGDKKPSLDQVPAGIDDGKNLGGVDRLQALRNASAAVATSKSGTATVIMKSEPAPLKGIVGSDAIKDAAAGSGGGNGGTN